MLGMVLGVDLTTCDNRPAYPASNTSPPTLPGWLGSKTWAAHQSIKSDLTSPSELVKSG